MAKNILKINTVFSDRLKKRCRELGYTTESKLLDAIQAKNPDFVDQKEQFHLDQNGQK